MDYKTKSKLTELVREHNKRKKENEVLREAAKILVDREDYEATVKVTNSPEGNLYVTLRAEWEIR